MLQRVDERQPQRLALLRELGRVGGLGQHAGVGDRLQPGRLGQRCPSALSAVWTAPRSIGRARRLRPSSMSRHTLVAILYSHDLNAERPSKRSMLRQARSIASCTASSASNVEPSMR